MLQLILKLYVESLKIHIGTKTKDKVFHEFTQEVYESLFEVFHTLAEKLEDIEKWEYTIDDCDTSKKRIYDIIEEIKKEVDENKGKYTTWFDNLARWLVDKLETLCGSVRSFIENEDKEDEVQTIKLSKNTWIKPY